MGQVQGIIDEAIACFQTALSLRPNYVEPRWALAMSQVAIVYWSRRCSTNYREQLIALPHLGCAISRYK
jgi:hypothetical protein